MLGLLADPDMTRERLIASFLEPPLHNTSYARGFGTLYTAAYFPTEGRAEYHWPGFAWRQSFARLHRDDARRDVRRGAPGGVALLGSVAPRHNRRPERRRSVATGSDWCVDGARSGTG